mmetsp:Transcript_26148/g.67570  ORF Transcript_26148/g.67570 Transcript_26148/m.67570 type:complete len:222 (+) Transcript_26148:67-732(+)
MWRTPSSSRASSKAKAFQSTYKITSSTTRGPPKHPRASRRGPLGQPRLGAWTRTRTASCVRARLSLRWPRATARRLCPTRAGVTVDSILPLWAGRQPSLLSNASGRWRSWITRRMVWRPSSASLLRPFPASSWWTIRGVISTTRPAMSHLAVAHHTSRRQSPAPPWSPGSGTPRRWLARRHRMSSSRPQQLSKRRRTTQVPVRASPAHLALTVRRVNIKRR